MQLKLVHNRGFDWASEKGLSVKGYAHTQDGRFLKTDGLLHYLSLVLHDEKNLISALKALNGIFSFVYSVGHEVYLYCDKSRFFPLFYRISTVTTVSDDPISIVQDGDTVDTLATEEFRCTGYTTGSDTLVNGIKQVPAGELLIIGHDLSVKRYRVFSYRVKWAELRPDNDPIGAMNVAIEKAAERFVQSIGDATPVLPLSGGYDSRLIACILKNHGYINTICFTYGRKTIEVDISQKVADMLGFKWYFVNYETLIDDRLSIDNEVFVRYYQYASKLTSMFYLQEYPALLYLMKHNLLPENCMFLPGHSGDLLGGSQFTKVFSAHISHKHIIDLMLRKKYFNYPAGRRYQELFYSRLKAQLEPDDTYLPYSIIEDWDIREKIAKFIFNSSQVFTFFGYQVRFLFWDNELVEFFRCLPPEYKNLKNLYNRCLQERYFARYMLNFDRELTPGPVKLFIQNKKDFLKPFLPRSIKHRFILKNDWACYEKLTRPMLAEISYSHRKKLPYNGFNSILINWYLQKVKDSLQHKSN
jgi:asparagine synthase (glutamine-hydrolysing)